MKKNGTRHNFDQLLTLHREARTLPIPHRLGLVHWLRGWCARPTRVFWELDPITGQWRRL